MGASVAGAGSIWLPAEGAIYKRGYPIIISSFLPMLFKTKRGI
jgi:hypothetical protein